MFPYYTTHVVSSCPDLLNEKKVLEASARRLQSIAPNHQTTNMDVTQMYRKIFRRLKLVNHKLGAVYSTSQEVFRTRMNENE